MVKQIITFYNARRSYLSPHISIWFRINTLNVEHLWISIWHNNLLLQAFKNKSDLEYYYQVNGFLAPHVAVQKDIKKASKEFAFLNL